MRVEARALTKHYGAVAALSDVSFAFDAGSRVALLGPNGSGKSTLNRAVLGLIRCDGELRVAGRDPFSARAELARRVAYVPQSAPQLAATVSELITASCGLRGFSLGDIEKLAARLDLSLSEIAARPFRSLSGGMKQKLLAALALAARPALLVLDEPTEELDVVSEAGLLDTLAELVRGEGTTVLFVTHELDLAAQRATHVALFEAGGVVAGTRDEVVASPAFARAFGRGRRVGGHA